MKVYGEARFFSTSRLSLTMRGMIATLKSTPLSAHPCGVPDSIGKVGEVLLFIKIRHVAWLYNDLIIEIVPSWKPRCLRVS